MDEAFQPDRIYSQEEFRQMLDDARYEGITRVVRSANGERIEVEEVSPEATRRVIMIRETEERLRMECHTTSTSNDQFTSIWIDASEATNLAITEENAEDANAAMELTLRALALLIPYLDLSRTESINSGARVVNIGQMTPETYARDRESLRALYQRVMHIRTNGEVILSRTTPEAVGMRFQGQFSEFFGLAETLSGRIEQMYPSFHQGKISQEHYDRLRAGAAIADLLAMQSDMFDMHIARYPETRREIAERVIAAAWLRVFHETDLLVHVTRHYPQLDLMPLITLLQEYRFSTIEELLRQSLEIPRGARAFRQLREGLESVTNIIRTNLPDTWQLYEEYRTYTTDQD